MVDRVLELVRKARASGIRTDGRVAGSMASSLRRALALALAGWNLVMVGVVVVADPRLATAPLVAAHVALTAVALAAAHDKFPLALCLTLGYAVWYADYAAARSMDDVLTLAACWLGNLLYVTSAFALRSRARTWLPLLGSSVVAAGLAAFEPIWRFSEASAFVVTAAAIVVAARLALPSLWGLAETADANIAALETELTTQEVLRRTNAEATEDARLVHDTVLNTLGAIASSGTGTQQPEIVRDRCLRDLAVVAGMLDGRRSPARRGLADVGSGSGLDVERTGLVGSDLDELGDVLAPEVVDALVGAAEEAVRNAGKHAGVRTVTVDVRRSELGILLTVTDRGSGFTGPAAPGHGISESIHGRLGSVGGGAVVDSAPGRGTVVRITCPLQPVLPRAVTVEADADAIADHLVRRACWLGSGGVVAVGVVIEAANRPGQLTWTYAMLALVAACTGVSYATTRHRQTLPAPVLTALVLALPLGFVATMAAIGFGTTQVITYQAIGIAPLLLVMLSTGAPRWAAVGSALLLATALVLAALRWTDEAGYGAIVVVGAVPAVGLATGWRAFQKLVHQIVAESEHVRVLAFEASLDAAAQSEIAAARRRWGTAGLERSAALLRGISTGALDVADPAVRAACAAEEQYLRQLLLLNPASYRVSVWFAHALAAARSRGLRLTIRSGDLDAPDLAVAGTVGALVLAAVADAPDDADLTVSWFATGAGARLSIVGPAPAATRTAVTVVPVPSTWAVDRQVLVGQEMVEVLVA